MTDSLLSLAAGVLPEFAPDEIVYAAADAGFEAVGIWFDPDTWDDTVAKRVRSALDTTGLIALDMEPIFVGPDGDHGDRLIDAAAACGAKNILTVSRGIEAKPFTERFAQLCDRAAPAGISVCVEFSRLFVSVVDLPTALQVVGDCGRTNAGVLVDNLHLARAGHEPSELAAAPNVFPYAQLCDGPALLSDTTRGALYADAVDGRQNLGEGQLPVLDVYRALPEGTPISLEIRSSALREQFPDPVDRARSVLEATKGVLGG